MIDQSLFSNAPTWCITCTYWMLVWMISTVLLIIRVLSYVTCPYTPCKRVMLFLYQLLPSLYIRCIMGVWMNDLACLVHHKCIILLHMSLYTLKTNDLTYWLTFATLCYIMFTYWMCLWMIWAVLSIINVLLSGVPDLCDRTKIPRCADLPHLHVPDSVWVFFYFVWFLFIHLNIYFYFESCTYCSKFLNLPIVKYE